MKNDKIKPSKVPETIFELTEKRIQELVKKEYEGDSCMPIYLLSESIDKDDRKEMVLTVTHIGWSYSITIHSHTNLRNTIVRLYNNTM